MSYLLVGNYGAGNLGDEALREYFLKRFPDVDWSVVSANPKKGEFARFPLGIRSFFKPWWRTISELRKSDGVVFGGGSLFTDIESRKACILWWWHAFIAWIFRKPVYLAFQGIGPFRTCMGDKLSRWVIDKADYISVRDEKSAVRIGHWFKHTNIIQTFDPVILLIEAEKYDNRSHNVLTIVPRKNSDKSFLVKAKEMSQFCKWEFVSILSLDPGNPDEKRICKEIRTLCGGEIKTVRSLDELCNEISKSCCVMSQRYHGGIVAIALGKKLESMKQVGGDKLDTLSGSQSVDELKKLALTGEKSLMEKLY